MKAITLLKRHVIARSKLAVMHLRLKVMERNALDLNLELTSVS